jgi:hypothetical protein
MFEFRFSMVAGGIERVAYVQIDEDKLDAKSPLFPPGHEFNKTYRENIIQQRLEKWALSHIDLNWEEVKGNDESNADILNSTTPEQHQA